MALVAQIPSFSIIIIIIISFPSNLHPAQHAQLR
jgi:hypothetical protein